MAWARFPNTVTVYPVTQTTNEGELAGIPSVGTGVPKMVDFQLMTPGDAYRDFGIELLNPAKLYAPAADLATFPQGARVSFEGVTYAVQNSMKREDGTGFEMSYTLAVLERVI